MVKAFNSGKSFSWERLSFFLKLRQHGSISHCQLRETAGCLEDCSEIVVLSLCGSDSIEDNRDAWALCHLQLGDDSTSVTIRTRDGPMRVSPRASGQCGDQSGGPRVIHTECHSDHYCHQTSE